MIDTIQAGGRDAAANGAANGAKVKTMLMMATVAASLALGGCATTGSVKRAQARADAAYQLGTDDQGAAQHAQGSADAAMGAAQHAQGSADAAGQSAQQANSTATAAQGYAQTTSGQIAALDSKVRHLEAQVHKLKGKSRHKGKGHHARLGKHGKANGFESQPAQFHN